MDGKGQTITAALAALVIGLAGGFFGHGLVSEDQPEAKKSLQKSTTDQSGAVAMSKLQAENDKLKGDVTRLEDAARTATPDNKGPANNAKDAELKSLKAQLSELAPLREELKEVKALNERMLKDPLIAALAADKKTMAALDAALDAIKPDWQNLAKSSVRMSELTDGMIKRHLAGEPMVNAEVGQELGALRAPLANYAIQTKVFVPSHSDSPNAAFTHPVTVVNLVREALAQNENPLTAAQEERLAVKGEEYMEALNQRASKYSDKTTKLRREADEFILRVEFIEHLRTQILTPEQYALIWHESTVGMNQLDVFSPSLMFIMNTATVDFTDAQAGRAEFVATLRAFTKLREETVLLCGEIFDGYVNSVRPKLTPVPLRAKDFWREQDLKIALEGLLALQEKLLAHASLNEEERKAIFDLPGVLIPRMIEPTVGG